MRSQFEDLTAGADLEFIAAYEIIGKLGSAVEVPLRIKNQSIDGRVAIGLIGEGARGEIDAQGGRAEPHCLVGACHYAFAGDDEIGERAKRAVVARLAQILRRAKAPVSG